MFQSLPRRRRGLPVRPGVPLLTAQTGREPGRGTTPGRGRTVWNDYPILAGRVKERWRRKSRMFPKNRPHEGDEIRMGHTALRVEIDEDRPDLFGLPAKEPFDMELNHEPDLPHFPAAYPRFSVRNEN